MWTFKWHRKHECSNATKCQTVFATDPTGLGRKVVVKLIEKPLNVEEALKIDCWHARMRKPGYGSLVPGSFSNRCRRTVFLHLTEAMDPSNSNCVQCVPCRARLCSFRWDNSVICPIVPVKLAVTAFISIFLMEPRWLRLRPLGPNRGTAGSGILRSKLPVNMATIGGRFSWIVKIVGIKYQWNMKQRRGWFYSGGKMTT